MYQPPVHAHPAQRQNDLCGPEFGKDSTQSRGYIRYATISLHWLSNSLREQEPKELSKIHGKMSKDLARAADRSGKPAACSFALVVKALSKHDLEGTGFVKVERLENWSNGAAAIDCHAPVTTAIPVVTPPSKGISFL